MNKDKRPQANTPSKAITNLYALIAIVIVIIPELIADLGIKLTSNAFRTEIKETDDIWNELPELRLSRMSLVELRNLAKEMRFLGYARENRKSLTKRLLKKLNKLNPKK